MPRHKETPKRRVRERAGGRKEYEVSLQQRGWGLRGMRKMASRFKRKIVVI